MKRMKICVCVLFLMLMLAAAPTLAAPVTDTGQTTCYNAGGDVIPCPSSGQDYYGQDANYTINPPSYTKLDEIGNPLPDSAASWVMVRDNVTGLIWEVKQDMDGTINYDNPHDADNAYTWYDPDPVTNGGNAGTPGNGTDTDDFIHALNNARFGGYSDWRMPGREELRSICDYGKYNPSIDKNYFPNTFPPNTVYWLYWSSTTYSGATDLVWNVDFRNGQVVWGGKCYPYLVWYYVRAVRGGQ